MLYVAKPMKIRVFQWKGLYNKETWPDFLPEPIVISEYNAIYSLLPNSLVLLKGNSSRGFIVENGETLYVVTKIGHVVAIYPNQYVTRSEEGALSTITKHSLNTHYDLIEE